MVREIARVLARGQTPNGTVVLWYRLRLLDAAMAFVDCAT